MEIVYSSWSENNKQTIGMTGTVCRVKTNYISVEHDSQIARGHTCGDTCPVMFGWDYDANDVVKLIDIMAVTPEDLTEMF